AYPKIHPFTVIKTHKSTGFQKTFQGLRWISGISVLPMVILAGLIGRIEGGGQCASRVFGG
ncbi:hypothetical protein, partial [Evtepia gabavorous]|uniref:hypothetical protein n=1 Tax=Evtepia gabavorous TaxID=2211183 RepID=UPI003A947C28